MAQAQYQDIEIPLSEPVHGLDSVKGVLGIPEWWPTGSRISVVLAQAQAGEDPLIEGLQRSLTERKFLTLRFCFPYQQAGKKKPDDTSILLRTFHSAVNLLGRDPTAAPAHVFIGGKNVGALAAAHAATSRLRIEGIFFMGYPLHKQDKAEDFRADRLWRIINPMLFLQGNKDRHCDLPALRATLGRVGAPVQLHVIDEADHTLKVAKKSGRTAEQVEAEVFATLEAWILKTLGDDA
ncbi:MAG: hypothetical protein GY723_20615 [bacterium]|nr:hypothetical protein [bacterium]MCP5066125.1 hypothetical protein [bacterium]